MMVVGSEEWWLHVAWWIADDVQWKGAFMEVLFGVVVKVVLGRGG